MLFRSPEQKKKQEFIETILLNSLQFEPDKRPAMSSILDDLISFEKKNTINFNYLKTEKIFQNEIMKAMKFDTITIKETEDTHIASKTEDSKLISSSMKADCSKCLNKINVKAELECNHFVCKDSRF